MILVPSLPPWNPINYEQLQQVGHTVYDIRHTESAQCMGLTENAGRENDGPAELQVMKLQDMKMTDQFARQEITRQEIAGHENDGHEHDGPKMTAGREIAADKVLDKR